MTLATFVPMSKADDSIISVDCPKHGHILHTENEIQASKVSAIHNKAYHPRALIRSYKKR